MHEQWDANRPKRVLVLCGLVQPWTDLVIFRQRNAGLHVKVPNALPERHAFGSSDPAQNVHRVGMPSSEI